MHHTSSAHGRCVWQVRNTSSAQETRASDLTMADLASAEPVEDAEEGYFICKLWRGAHHVLRREDFPSVQSFLYCLTWSQAVVAESRADNLAQGDECDLRNCNEVAVRNGTVVSNVSFRKLYTGELDATWQGDSGKAFKKGLQFQISRDGIAFEKHYYRIDSHIFVRESSSFRCVYSQSFPADIMEGLWVLRLIQDDIISLDRSLSGLKYFAQGTARLQSVVIGFHSES